MMTPPKFWITVLVLGSTSSAGVEYFGKDDMYVCHCRGGCSDKGNCHKTCFLEFFGQHCQYYDHGKRTSSSEGVPERLFKRKSSFAECNAGPVEEARYTTAIPYVFHSVEFRTTRSYNGEDIEIKLNKSKDDINLSPCSNKYVVWIKKYRSVFVSCDRVKYTTLSFTGPGLAFLCSIHITSGRNIAAQQAVETEGTIIGHSKKNYANDEDSFTCLELQNQDQNVQLKISMRTPVYLNIISLSIKGNKEPLEKTSIQGFSGSSVAFEFEVSKSLLETEGEAYFYYVDQSKSMPITSLLLKRKDSLRLCEIYAIGDSYCPHGYVGFDCERPCVCAKNNTCPAVEWECGIRGCGLGYTGKYCGTPCAKGTYGLACAETCPSYCADGDCRKDNGQCFRCPDGKYGTLCDKEVDPETSVRVTPKEPCENCVNKNKSCDAVDGLCKEGCAPGYLDALCDLKCPSDHYGDFCAETCPTNCKMGECHHVKGTCLNGCERGYTGHNCDQECPGGTYGQECGFECNAGCGINKENKSSRVCDFINGTCIYGCKTGFEGIDCHESAQEPSSPPPSSSGTSFIAIAILLISVGILLFLFCRKKAPEESAESDLDDLAGLPEEAEVKD